MNENIVNTSAGSPSNLIKYFSNDNNNNDANKINQNHIKKQTNTKHSITNYINTNNVESCSKCGQKVYQVEKIGPVNQVIFHKGCFKCLKCGQNLTLKNYFTNPLDSSDKQVYCAKDCPKVPLGGIDARAFGIRAAMMAPSSKMNSSNSDVIRWFGDVPKIGADAMHIREAVSAQSEFQRKNLIQNKHNFPGWIKSKKKILEYQKELEKEQKIEEDRLVENFQKERLNVARVVDSEISHEWEENLRKITDNFERQNRRKESISYSKELDELSKTMTSKRKSKMAVMTMKLQTTAREKTADLVKLQSEQMLSLLKKKQEELKLELKNNSENPEELAGALSAMTLPSEIPDAHAPRIRKRDLYHDPVVFTDLDEYVFKVAETEHNTFTDLVAQLTATCISDLEKARAIFRWITVKDLNVMTFSDSVKQDTPLGLLRGIKFGTETYHTLFMRLCSYAGLVCREVKGNSKSVGYEPGMKIRAGNFTNTWNIVLINSDWWPVQSNWGARHLVMNKDQANPLNQQHTKKGRDKIRYEYDEHYFLTDPDEFVMEFLAEDEKWQLLENPMTLSQFESLPFIRSVFFHNGLEFGEGCKDAIIDTNSNGGVEIKITMPADSKDLIVFHYHLKFSDRERRKETQYNGIEMERYVFHTIADNLALFSIHVPLPANYFIEIFASKIEERNKVIEAKKSFEPFKLKCAAKFLLRCSHISGKLYPLPNCAPGEWGPMKAIRYFDIQPITHTVGVINVENNISIKLQLPSWMKILIKLYYNGIERRALDKFLNVKIDDQKVITASIQFPQKGQFGIDMYGQPEDSMNDTTSLAHICKYLINVTQVSNPVTLPPPSLQRNHSVASSIVPMQMIELSYEEGDDQTFDSNTVKENTSGEITYQDKYETRESYSPIYQNSVNRSQPLPVIPQQQTQLQPRTQTQMSTQQSFNHNNYSLDSFVSGPTPLFKAFGLKTSSHKNSRIGKFDKNGSFVTEFSKSVEVKLAAKLVSKYEENFSDLVCTKDSNKKCKFSVNLPSYGTYILSISACNQHGQSQNMVDVYHYELKYHDPKASLQSKSASMKKNKT